MAVDARSVGLIGLLAGRGLYVDIIAEIRAFLLHALYLPASRRQVDEFSRFYRCGLSKCHACFIDIRWRG